MIAEGTTPKHIYDVSQRILSLFHQYDIETTAQIRRETIERWIASERQKNVRSTGTINA